LKEKPLFATILERLEQQNSNKKEKWTILASLFASQVSIVLNEKTVRENFVRLTFESSDKDLLSSLKQNLSSLKLNHLLSDTEKLNVQIPFEIIKQLDDVKRFLESLGSEASEENFSALQACYKFTREQISSKLPWNCMGPLMFVPWYFWHDEAALKYIDNPPTDNVSPFAWHVFKNQFCKSWKFKFKLIKSLVEKSIKFIFDVIVLVLLNFWY